MDEPIIDIADKYTYGEKVTIECKAEGNPAPHVSFSWTKDDRSIVVGSSHTFNRIKGSDEGSYTCTAKNDANELTSTKDITVDSVWISAQMYSFIAPATVAIFAMIVNIYSKYLDIRRSDTNRENQNENQNDNQSEYIPLNEVENNTV